MKLFAISTLLSSLALVSLDCRADDSEYLKLVPEAKNTIVSKLPSPDGKNIAYIFERNAGATTSFSTQISVLHSSDPEPTDGGNVFVIDEGNSSVIKRSWGGPLARIHWTAPEELVVTYPSKSRIFEKVDRISGIRLIYKTFEAEQGAAANP